MGERLSWLSSALPSGVVADHGVEDGEELAHHGREGELFSFSGGGQPLVERLKKGIVAAGDEGGHVEGTAHLGPAAPGRALATHFSAVAVEGSDADQGSDLLAIETSELGQIGNQRA